jgi:hypothetical protein
VSTTPKLHVQGDAAARKAQPIARGCLDYFPDALLAVAELSRIGNEQHNPGEPLHWAKEKSTDEADALVRHLIDRGTIDTDGVRHSTKVAWRALALLQREIDASRAQADHDAAARPLRGAYKAARDEQLDLGPPYVAPKHEQDHLLNSYDRASTRLRAQLDADDCSICGRPCTDPIAEAMSAACDLTDKVWPAS